MKQMTMEAMCLHTGIPFEYVEAGRVSPEEEKVWKELFQNDETAFFETLDQQEKRCETALYLSMKWAVESYEEYQQAGLSDKIYFDNYIDLGIWYRTCLEQTKIPGISEYRWTSLPLKRKIYRLGRLQFEPTHLQEDVKVGEEYYKMGTPAMEVHIPEGEGLSPKAVQDAFQQAELFFEKTVPYSYELYHCESWLLSPGLKALLPIESNILKFQSLFSIYQELPSLQAEERVFRTVKEKPSDYPENTKLQRRLKQYLLDGKTIGMGYGIIKRF